VRVVKRIFVPRKYDIVGGRRKLLDEELYNLCALDVIGMIK
jgi:hypothetical protein